MSVSVESSELTNCQTPRLLLISGRPDSSPLVEAISRAGISFSTIASWNDAILSLQQEAPAVAILDLTLSGMEGLDVLRSAKADGIPTAIIAVSRVGSLRLAIEAMKLGAFDYLVEPFNSEQLLSIIQKATIHALAGEQIVKLDIPHSIFRKHIDASPLMREIGGIIENADAGHGTVLISGDNEIGRDVCAHAIHSSSARHDQPFVAVHCAAIPPEMIESEIFGHVRGALATAFMDRTGAVTEADGGTLLLNDVRALSFDLQAKIVRLIEESSFQRLGSAKLQRADLRIICSNNREPQLDLQDGLLSEELFNRLQSAIIHLPPLHQCSKDIMQIAELTLQDISARNNLPSKDKQDADTESSELPLTGDVRELQSALYNAITLNGSDHSNEVVRPDSLAKDGTNAESIGGSEVVFVEASVKTVKHIKPLWLVEKEAITEALEICGQNVPKAAAYLEVGVSTIYRKKAEWEAEERSKAS